jgi:hypothetical protein
MVEVVLRAVRVYGAMSYFGSAPRAEPAGSPIAVQGREPGDRVTVHFGLVPDWVPHAQRVSFVMVTRSATGKSIRDDPKAEDRSLDTEISTAPLAQVWEQHNWFTTVVVESQCKVDDADIQPGRYWWLDWGRAIQLDREFAPHAQAIQREVIAYLAPAVRPEHFTDQVLDRIFFSTGGRETFSLPQITVGGLNLYTRSAAFPDLSEATRRLETALRQPLTRSLRLAHQWYAQALIETDEFKRFLWGYFALETLINHLFDRHFRTALTKLGTESEQPGSPGAVAAVTALIGEQGRVPAIGRFAAAALALNLPGLEEDIRDFKDAKRARDNLAHGGADTIAALPTHAVMRLLAKYLSAAPL